MSVKANSAIASAASSHPIPAHTPVLTSQNVTVKLEEHSPPPKFGFLHKHSAAPATSSGTTAAQEALELINVDFVEVRIIFVVSYLLPNTHSRNQEMPWQSMWQGIRTSPTRCGPSHRS
jgi:hypothetical protein